MHIKGLTKIHHTTTVEENKRMNKKELTQVNFLAFKEDWLEFKKIAEKKLLPVSILFRHILHDFIEKQKN